MMEARVHTETPRRRDAQRTRRLRLLSCYVVAGHCALQNQPPSSADLRNPLEFSSVPELHQLWSMLADPAPFKDLTRKILGGAIEVHRTLGPGLLESTYLQCLQHELTARKLRYAAQRSVPIIYKGTLLDASYRVDLIVEDRVIVEVKSVDALAPVHEAQVITYLRLTGCPVGLLINFNVPRLMDGVKRKINTIARYQAEQGNGTTGS
jgi:GxxExxY protein